MVHGGFAGIENVSPEWRRLQARVDAVHDGGHLIGDGPYFRRVRQRRVFVGGLAGIVHETIVPLGENLLDDGGVVDPRQLMNGASGRGDD
jgi:hypothetical protein